MSGAYNANGNGTTSWYDTTPGVECFVGDKALKIDRENKKVISEAGRVRVFTLRRDLRLVHHLAFILHFRFVTCRLVAFLYAPPRPPPPSPVQWSPPPRRRPAKHSSISVYFVYIADCVPTCSINSKIFSMSTNRKGAVFEKLQFGRGLIPNFRPEPFRKRGFQKP